MEEQLTLHHRLTDECPGNTNRVARMSGDRAVGSIVINHGMVVTPSSDQAEN